MNKVALSWDEISGIIRQTPVWGIVLGSGLQSLIDLVQDPISISFQEIEGFPQASVEGHSGKVVFGTLHGIPVAVLAGRIHYYEGGSIDQVTMPIRFLRRMGIQSLLLTNAAGAVNTEFVPGDLMCISDHINFSGTNPLRGPNDESVGPRFPDQTHVYDEEYRDRLRRLAKTQGVDLKSGVYMWFSGPTYETPAEVRMARIIGADAVGMSTVPEAMVANHAGIRVLGISMITNAAAGVTDDRLTHEDVLETGQAAASRLQSLISEFFKELEYARS